MNALESLAALAGDRVAMLQAERERNRARFPTAAEGLDWLNAHFPCAPGTRGHRVVYAENFNTGERVGKPA